jgi:hypothetical protein
MSEIAPVVETITDKIFEIRKQRVILDRDLAELYGVTTGNLNKAVKRNAERFPADFMLQLTDEEWQSLLFQIGRPKKSGRGGTRFAPCAFTEQGVAMLSAVLNSPRAVHMSILIMRAFVRLREILAEDQTLRYAIEGLERRVGKNERDIQIALGALQKLLNPPAPPKPDRKIGFLPR